MGLKTIRWLSFLALLVGLVWVIREPGYESGITSIVLLVGLVSVLRAGSGSENRVHIPEQANGKPPPADAISGPPESHSVLVLPMRVLGPREEDTYLGEGLSEEIIVDLSSIRSLRVISQNSAMRLRGSDRAPAELAQELGVAFVLEGTLRAEGSSVRVTTRLVDARTGSDAWAGRFDGEVSSILGIQEKISAGIVQALKLNLDPSLNRGAARRLPDDPRALEAYLKARHEIWDFSIESLQRAVGHLEHGLEVAGEQEILLATLGEVYCNFTQVVHDDPAKWLRQAESVVDRIFALDPDSPDGFRLRGWVEFQAGRLRNAGPWLKRAWEADPMDPDTNLMLGYYYAVSGQADRARPLLQHLASIDPLTPMSQCMTGFVDVMEGQFEEALGPYGKFLSLSPNNAFAQGCWVWVLLLNRRFEEARSTAETLVREHPESPFAPLFDAATLAVQGKHQEAVARLNSLPFEHVSQNEYFTREIAHTYALAGESDQAVMWMERNIEVGNINYPFLKNHDWFFDGLREDPRFDELLERVRLEWEAFYP